MNVQELINQLSKYDPLTEVCIVDMSENDGEYLKETLDPFKLKNTLKSFNSLPEDKYTIHGDLKDLSNELTNEFNNLKLPYNKLISLS